MAVIVIMFLGSCKKNPEPFLSNSMIMGWAHLQDSMYNKDVRIDAYGPYGRSSAYTDSSGNFKIGDLGNGTYRVEFSKQGFGTIKEYGVQLFGSDSTFLWAEMPKKYDDYTLPNFTKVYTSNDNSFSQGQFAILTDQVGGEVPVFVYLSDKNNVSWSNYRYFSKGITVSRNGFGVQLVFFDLTADAFPPGSKVYLIVYPGNSRDDGYYDPYLGQIIYSSLVTNKHSKILSFNMP
jgi:hypothetical protein